MSAPFDNDDNDDDDASFKMNFFLQVILHVCKHGFTN